MTVGGRCTRCSILALVLTCGLVITVSATVQPAATTAADVRRLIQAGRYDEAESCARALYEAAAHEDARALATADAADLLVQSLLLNGKGAQATTRSLAESALRDKEALL